MAALLTLRRESFPRRNRLPYQIHAQLPTTFRHTSPLSIDLELDSQTYRSIIYVNGWQFGRFIANLGPQASYPSES